LTSITSGYETAIYLFNVSNGLIKNVTIFSSRYPITYISNGTYLAKETMNGVEFYNSYNDTIEHSKISNLTGGIGFYDSEHINIIDNNISNVVIDGIGAEYLSFSLIQGDKIANDHHNNIQLINSDAINVTGNILRNANGDNLWFWNTNDSNAINNTASICPEQSILVYPGNFDNITGNTVFNVNQGIVVFGNYSRNSHSILFDNNQSIILSGSRSSEIKENRIFESKYGISLNSESYSTVVYHNTVNNTKYAIYNSNSPNVTFYDNILFSNSYGIYIQNSPRALVYNNYLSNFVNAVSDSVDERNVTPYQGLNIIGGDIIAGNYWSDYPGSGRNGIGTTDIPFDENGNIEFGGDYAPLVADKSPSLILRNVSGSYYSNIYVPTVMYDGNAFLNLTEVVSFNPDLLSFVGVLDDVSSQYVNFTFRNVTVGTVEIFGHGVFYSFGNNTTFCTLVFKPLVDQQFRGDIELDFSTIGNYSYFQGSVAILTVSSGWETIGPKKVKFQFGGTPVENGSVEVTCLGFTLITRT